VLLTSGFTAGLNVDPFHGPMVSLPLAIFEFVKSPEPTMIARGFGTAAVLMFIVLLLFVIARIIGGQTIAKRERRADRFRAIGSGFRSLARWTTDAAASALHFFHSRITRMRRPATPGPEKDGTP